MINNLHLKSKVGHPPREPLNDNQKKQLYDLYYNQKNFFGRDKLFKLVEQNNWNISRRQLYDWLKDQHIHQLFQQPLKTKTIKSTILNGPNIQVGIDLMDMQHYEVNDYKYILTTIDLFSKRANALPLKNKQDSTVATAMEVLLKGVLSGVRSIRSDNGSEFISNIFKKLLKKYKVKQILSTSHTPQSNGQIENFNKQLKRLIKMNMTVTKDRNWPSYLQQLVSNYNNSVHSTTGFTPNYLHSQNDKLSLQKAHDNIEKKVLLNKKDDKPKFNKGEIVRIKIKPDDRDKLGNTFSDNLYVVKTVYRPRNSTTAPYYTVVDKETNDVVRKRFYNNDLLLVTRIDNPITEESNIYVVSRLIQPVILTGDRAYIVAWKGFRKKSDRTIQTREQLLEDVPKLVHEYERMHKINWDDVDKYTK